jgi:hypothetical protein
MPLRTYSKLELAKLYYPEHSEKLALQNLWRAIRRSEELHEKLQMIWVRTGSNAYSRYYSAEEVEIIAQLLGIPGKFR